MSDSTSNSYNRYKLDTIKTKIKHHKIIAFDVETYNNNTQFLVGDAYDGITHHTFYTQDDMRKYLIKKRHPNTFICATNLSFDFMSMIDVKELPKCKIISKGGRFIMASYSHVNDDGDEKFSNKFLDTLNHYAGGVESAGKLLGLKKLEYPVCFIRNDKGEIEDVRKPVNHDEWNELIIYNQRDTEVTHKLMEFLQDAYNHLGCEMKVTIAGTAMNLYRRKFLPQPLWKEQFILNDDSIVKKIFDSYYGGRTEVFKRGLAKNVKLYDVNSLYPYCMTLEYPLPQSVFKPPVYTVQNIIDYHGFSEVIIYCPKMHIPLLPFRDEMTKKLIFPTGTFKGCYTHVELRKAIELGYEIKEIVYQYCYSKTFYPYKDYVEFLYNERLKYKAEGSSMELVTKLLLNSLYGKFGQRDFLEQEWFDIDLMSQDDYKNYLHSNNSRTFENIGYYTNVKECDSNFVFPILPSYVTAYGRLEIYKYLTKYDAYYCDTDSVITKHEIEDSKDLGKMKLEQNLKRVIIIRPKMYLKEDDKDVIKIKLKGLPRAGIDAFNTALAHKKVQYRKFTKLNESIIQGLQVNTTRLVEKKINLEDNKRVWTIKFNPEMLDDNSIAHDVIHTKHKDKKIVHRKTVYERMLYAQQQNDKVKNITEREYIDSDLFDKLSVGTDISSEEFIKNEKWFSRYD